jgi:mRNA-degrading endonuclease YafQ of YafQ-DinJ toxin-antitoxin module
MVESPAATLRRLMDLCEGKKDVKKAPQVKKQATEPEGKKPFGIMLSNSFVESLAKTERTFPKIREQLLKFARVKRDDPINGKYSSQDYPYSGGGPLAGYHHCHLRDDAILIYTIKNNCLNLLFLCAHADVEGKMLHRMAKILGGLSLHSPSKEEMQRIFPQTNPS